MDASAWDQRYAAVDHVWSLEPNRFVAAELADLAPGRALDLACGEGRNAIWLARCGWHVTAVDFSPVAVDRARRFAGHLDGARPVTWVVGDVMTAALPESDLVVMAYLQLPPDQRRAVVRRAFAALASGGTLFVVAHDSTNLTEGTGGPQDPSVLYTAEDVLSDLTEDAWPADETVEIVRAQRVARVVPQQDEHGGRAEATAWDALARVVRR